MADKKEPTLADVLKAIEALQKAIDGIKKALQAQGVHPAD